VSNCGKQIDNSSLKRVVSAVDDKKIVAMSASCPSDAPCTPIDQCYYEGGVCVQDCPDRDPTLWCCCRVTQPSPTPTPTPTATPTPTPTPTPAAGCQPIIRTGSNALDSVVFCLGGAGVTTFVLAVIFGLALLMMLLVMRKRR